MKKFAVMMVVVLGAAFAAQADVLMYFTANAFDWSGPKLFEFAMVGVAKDGETNWGTGGSQVYAKIYPSYDSKEGDIFLASDGERYRATGWADITEYADTDAGYTFYVETYANTSDDPIIGYSADTAKTYAQLVQENHIYDTTSTAPQDLTAWNVPEPTSGMLLLLGSALLALKRKREK